MGGWCSKHYADTIYWKHKCRKVAEFTKFYSFVNRLY